MALTDAVDLAWRLYALWPHVVAGRNSNEQPRSASVSLSQGCQPSWHHNTATNGELSQNEAVLSFTQGFFSSQSV